MSFGLYTGRQQCTPHSRPPHMQETVTEIENVVPPIARRRLRVARPPLGL